MNEEQLRILEYKEQRDALVLAHYYQTMDIQAVADFVGDSFEMAKKAHAATQSVIIVCGVHFMAESAKLLAPDKRVMIPAPDAGCPMADMVTPEDVAALRQTYPDAAVMCYVNTSAAVKAVSDVCCTSSSAVRIARRLPQKQIIFVPDGNLGRYVAGQTPEKDFIFFEGYCPIHHAVTQETVDIARTARPDSLLLVHPECRPEVTAQADFVGSTSQILSFVENSEADSFLIGTEQGVVERLRITAPGKQVYPLRAGFLCPNMKKTRISDLLETLLTLDKEHNPKEVRLPADVAADAARALNQMVQLGS